MAKCCVAAPTPANTKCQHSVSPHNPNSSNQTRSLDLWLQGPSALLLDRSPNSDHAGPQEEALKRCFGGMFGGGDIFCTKFFAPNMYTFKTLTQRYDRIEG